MRYAARVDATHKAIVDTLRACGCSVYNMRGERGAPDLVVGIGGTTHLIECKTQKGRLNEAQVKWHQGWRGGPVAVLRTADEALAWVNDRRKGLVA